MPGSYGSRGVKPSQGGGWKPLPKGRYLLRVFEAEQGITGKGHDKVTVHFKVIEPAEFKGKEVKYHTLTFLPAESAGAGIVIHFLKCIGEPWQESDNLEWDEANWVGKRVWADVDIEFMKDREGKFILDDAGEKRPKNVVKAVYFGPDTRPEDQKPEPAKAPAASAANDDEVPF